MIDSGAALRRGREVRRNCIGKWYQASNVIGRVVAEHKQKQNPRSSPLNAVANRNAYQSTPKIFPVYRFCSVVQVKRLERHSGCFILLSSSARKEIC